MKISLYSPEDSRHMVISGNGVWIYWPVSSQPVCPIFLCDTRDPTHGTEIKSDDSNDPV